jgi:hypothetical protein
LAAASEQVAGKLDAGDARGARGAAVALQREVVAAIDAGRVPAALRAPLLAGVRRLVARIPPPPATKTPTHKGKGEHEGKEKHGGGDD